MDESSIAINKEIDQSLFTLDPNQAKSVYDAEEQARLLGKVEKEHKSELANPPSSRSSSSWLIAGNLALLVAVVFVAGWLRRK